MSLQTRLQAFATRVAAEFKAVRAEKANVSHTHPYQPASSELGTIAGLSPADGSVLRRISGAWAAATLTAPDVGAAPTTHAHAGADITSGTVPYARLPVGTTASTVAAGNDSRLSDARTPLAHVHSGADITSGTVPYARLPVGTAASTVAAGDDSRITGAQQTSAKGAASGYAGLDASAKVPIAQLPTGTTSSTVALGSDARFSDARTPTTHAASHASGGSDPVTPAAIGAAAATHMHSGADITTGTVGYARLPVGTTASTVAAGNDSRLSDARTPTAHAASHASGGSDVITPAAIGAVGTSDARLTDARAWSLYTPGGEAAGNVPTWDAASGRYKPGAPTSGSSGGGGYRSGFVPAGSTTPVIQHDLGSSDLIVSIQDASGRLITEVPVETVDGTGAASDNHIRLTFNTAPTANQYRYTIVSAAPAPTVAQHTHDASAITTGTLAPARLPIGTAAGTVAAGDDSRITGAVQSTRQVIAGTGLTGGGTLAADRTLAVAYGTAAGTAAQGNDSRITGAVQSTRQVIAGTGLTGGGTLAADRTLAVAYGTAAGTAAQGNDSRITGAQQTSQKDQPNGYAGLDAAGRISPSEMALVDNPIRTGSVASSLTSDASSGGNLINLTITGDATINAPTNPADHQRLRYHMLASGGSRLITWGSTVITLNLPDAYTVPSGAVLAAEIEWVGNYSTGAWVLRFCEVVGTEAQRRTTARYNAATPTNQTVQANTTTVAAFGVDITADCPFIIKQVEGAGHNFLLNKRGIYAISTTIRWAAGQSNERYNALDCNGQTIGAANGLGNIAQTNNIAVTREFWRGDVVRVSCWAGGTAGLLESGPGWCRIDIVYLGGLT